MTAGMAGFAINDTIVKTFAGELGIGQTLLLRGVIATVLVWLLARRFGHMRPLVMAFQPLIALRTAGELTATFLFLNALFHLPIANASAILQVLPLALTLFAAIIFREAVGWRRYVAVAIGFAGVLIVIRPGLEGFSGYSIYALGAVAGCVVRDLATRRLDAAVPALFITFVAALAVTAMGGVLSLSEAWQPVTAGHLGLLALSALFLLNGYFFVVSAMRTGEIGFVQPFRYTILLFSIIGGIVVFGEYPDFLTYLGSAIVVATGIYTLYRERIVRRQAITPLALSRS